MYDDDYKADVRARVPAWVEGDAKASRKSTPRADGSSLTSKFADPSSRTLPQRAPPKDPKTSKGQTNGSHKRQGQGLVSSPATKKRCQGA